MKKIFASTAVVAGFAAAFAVASSGLNVGENISPFHPTHVAGPLKDSTNCFPCTFKNAPQVQVWVNGDSMENVAGIAKLINAEMKENKSFKGLVVLLTDDAEKAKKTLKKAAGMPGLESVGMAYMSPSDKAVKAYKVNTSADVKNTVFVYENWKVSAKFVNLKADEAGLKSLNQAINAAVAN